MDLFLLIIILPLLTVIGWKYYHNPVYPNKNLDHTRNGDYENVNNKGYGRVAIIVVFIVAVIIFVSVIGIILYTLFEFLIIILAATSIVEHVF